MRKWLLVLTSVAAATVFLGFSGQARAQSRVVVRPGPVGVRRPPVVVYHRRPVPVRRVVVYRPRPRVVASPRVVIVR